MKNDKGFTLFELVFCIALVGIGAVFVGVAYSLVHFLAKVW